MRTFDLFSIGLQSARRFRFRTLMTLFTIIISILALVQVISFGDAIRQSTVEALSAIGGTHVVSLERRPGRRRPIQLLSADAQMLEKNCASVSRVIGEVGPISFPVKVGGKWRRADCMGVSLGYDQSYQWPVTDGRFFNQLDQERFAPVVILGQQVAQELFPASPPLGQYVKIAGQRWQVIGIMSRRGNTQFTRGWDRRLLMPAESMQRRLTGTYEFSGFRVELLPEAPLPQSRDEIGETLKIRHQRRVVHLDIRTAEDELKSVRHTEQMLKILLGGLAGIGLLVAGVNLMNVQLIAIHQRIGEIGLRLALGARQTDILVQFLAESVLVCLGGGLIGVILSLGTLGWIQPLIQGIVFPDAHVAPVISLPTLFFSLSLTVCVGLTFGIYPAFRASKVMPAESLRFQ